MKRKTAIFFSMVGIILVILILLGLTYAYFVTQIQGNGNDKSIEVSTANLRLTYADGNGTITANNIMPGTTTEEKIFTVKNNGNQTVGNYKVYLERVINTFVNTSDVTINMTCNSDVENKTCTGLENFTFPSTNDVLVSNSIDVNETQTYSLTVTYKETGVDQSVDMNKTISGKIQIYDARNIVDISGIVVDAMDGDYVELHSVPKISQINANKEYKITAVTPGEHTFYVKDSEGNVKGSKTITINRTNFVSHYDTTININSEASNIKMDVTTIDVNLEIKINNIILNPYNYNSKLLTYNIVNNAQVNRKRTTYEPTPITVPGMEISKIYSYNTSNYFESNLTTLSTTINPAQQDYYFTYSDKFIFDKTTGQFNLDEPKVCKYSECYLNLVNKYILSYDTSLISSSTNSLTLSHNLNSIYKIVEAPVPNSEKKINLKLQNIYNIADVAKRTLINIDDGNGDSYYFRGDILDNYVNFNGMCWRIVRIESDGSTKLVLEDNNTTCNSKSYTGNCFYGSAVFGYETITANDGTNVLKDEFVNYKGGLQDKLQEFQNKKMSEVLNKLKPDEWCYGNKAFLWSDATDSISDIIPYIKRKQNFYYSASKFKVNKSPSLICEGTKISKYNDNTNMYVGVLTADEVALAGGKYDTANYYYFLMNDFNRNVEYTSLLSPDRMSSNGQFSVLVINKKGSLYSYSIDYGTSVRPAVTLNNTVELFSGDGTKTNPYEIK